MSTQTIERPVQRPAADGAALAITVERPPDLKLDDESHTPPHGDALLLLREPSGRSS